MSTLVVLAFDDERKGEEALQATLDLSAQHHLGLADACVVVRHRDGRVRYREANDVRAGWGAVAGGGLGLIAGLLLGGPVIGLALGTGLGALKAKLHDSGISDAFERQIAESVSPGTSAIILLLDSADLRPAVAAYAPLGARILYTDLRPEAQQAIRAALQGAAATMRTGPPPTDAPQGVRADSQ